MKLFAAAVNVIICQTNDLWIRVKTVLVIEDSLCRGVFVSILAPIVLK